MQTSKSFLIKVGLIAGAAIGALALSAIAQSGSWSPSCPPSAECNVAAPLNVGTSFQEKLGPLQLGNTGIVGTFSYATGTPQAGQVLTAINSLGTAVWADAPGSSFSLTAITPVMVFARGYGFASGSTPEYITTSNCNDTGNYVPETYPGVVPSDAKIVALRSYAYSNGGNSSGNQVVRMYAQANNLPEQLLVTASDEVLDNNADTESAVLYIPYSSSRTISFKWLAGRCDPNDFSASVRAFIVGYIK